MENLRKVRNELLSLHKTLMEIEKENYEAKVGKISPNQLLQMLFENGQFAWLRAISGLVVEIDEMLADKKGFDQDLAASLVKKTKTMFDESDHFRGFKVKYQANLDTEGSVSDHHRKLQNLLENEKA